MLQAFRSELYQLAETDVENFAKKIGKQIPFEDVATTVDALKGFIIMMPAMIWAIHQAYNAESVPDTQKKLLGFVLTYLYHPHDFISEEKHGLYGYLDDAFLVGLIYQHTMQFIPEPIKNQHVEMNKQMSGWLATTRRVIPQESRLMEQLVGELLAGKIDRFEAMMNAAQ